MTSKEFAQPFMLLCEMYNREASQLLMDGYYLVLECLTKEEFEIAIKQVLSSRKYSTLPMPADILEAVHGNPDDKAILALKELENAMSEHGAYKSVSFKDNLIATCVENLGGWVTVCQMELKDWEWKKKEFTAFYKALMRNPQNVRQMPYLVGIAEHQNRFRGFDEIANETKVMMVGFEGEREVLCLELHKGAEVAQISMNKPKGNRDIAMLTKRALNG